MLLRYAADFFVPLCSGEVEKSAEAAAPASPPPPDVTRVQVEQKPIDVRSVLWSGSMNVAGLVSQALLLVFRVYFLFGSGDLSKRKLVRLAGEPRCWTRSMLADRTHVAHGPRSRSSSAWLFWAWGWVWGMLLAVPMLVIVKAVCDRVDEVKPVGEILGE